MGTRGILSCPRGRVVSRLCPRRGCGRKVSPVHHLAAPFVLTNRLAKTFAALGAFATWAAFAALVTGVSCTSEPRAQQALSVTPGISHVRAAGVLRWGADQQGGEPYAFDDPKRPGTLVGFEVEIADALARHIGVRATFVQADWSTLIPSLERGTFDVALNGVEVTPALHARVAFTRPYFIFAERLVARADDARVRDLASLRGLRVGTLAATQAWHTLLQAGAHAIPYEGVEEPFIDLENGRTDAVLLDDIIVDRY
ncbi:MAG: amino acid ABC transporter substrate-binding protein, partial [Deltaproteobacteria bacterium]|nr:amino acid ABC transporter substrate-binding protein [Deltaproteobacteria bacterium]